MRPAYMVSGVLFGALVRDLDGILLYLSLLTLLIGDEVFGTYLRNSLD
jgi:hypothetical protein